jgi:hypothetical protein
MTRFEKVMSFNMNVDRVPMIEWAPWWDKTLSRWFAEGLEPGLTDDDLKVALGLDRSQRCRFRCLGKQYPELPFGQGAVEDMASYEALKQYLYPADQYDVMSPHLQKMKMHQDAGEPISWFGFDGFFWLPRVLLGIEKHLYAFYDSPDLIHKINLDLLEYNKKLFCEAIKIIKPDFVTISEDMSYKQGPMISKKLFNEFIRPYYLELIPVIKEKQVYVFVDTDGNVDELTGWLLECGVDGILPVERQSGSSPVKLREKYPKLLMIGGFDKTVMKYGEKAMVNEFDSIARIIKDGGFLPSCDHQTPPDVSLSNYRTYVYLLNEYCRLLA